MKRWFLFLGLLLGGLAASRSWAVESSIAPPSTSSSVPTTAFEALRLLPPEIGRRIAIIEGREGAPVPERWYLVVYDPAQENHLVEYVVADHRVVAARTLSQFAEQLSADQVIPTDSPLFNSDQASQLAQQFAQANNVRIPKMNYELKKEGVGAAPLWKITCLDDNSTAFAQVTFAAASGMVVRSDGFNFSPNRYASEPRQAPSANTDRSSSMPRSEPQAIEDQTANDNSNVHERRPVYRESYASNRHTTEGNREGRTAYTGRRTNDRDRNQNPPPVAQRPQGGLFGAIRRLFSR